MNNNPDQTGPDSIQKSDDNFPKEVEEGGKGNAEMKKRKCLGSVEMDDENKNPDILKGRKSKSEPDSIGE